ncbi:MAG: aldehyde dehydrogenase family protein [Candidatus Binatia bacterium]
MINAGQTCLGAGHLFVPEEQARRLHLRRAAHRRARRYPDINDRSYTSIIDEKSGHRLRHPGGRRARRPGGTAGPRRGVERRPARIPAHLVLDVTDEMTIMRDEIFGPLFPVKTCRSLRWWSPTS